MLSSRRIVLLGALALGACGFTPVYGPGGGGTLRGAILLAEPSDTDSFAFVEAFEERLGLPASPRFAMEYTLTTTQSGQAITGSNDITRFTVQGSADYVVTPMGGEVPVASGTVQTFTSYSASGSTIATLTAERDAQARLMQLLAEQIATRLLANPALR